MIGGQRIKCISTNLIKLIKLIKLGVRPQPAYGGLWVCTWFLEIVFQKVCVRVCLYVCIFVCLSVTTSANH